MSVSVFSDCCTRSERICKNSFNLFTESESREEKVLQEFSVYNLNRTFGFLKLSYEEDNYSIISTSTSFYTSI